MSTTTEPERTFAHWAATHAGGATHSELTDTMRRLVAAVRDTGRAGSMTLTVHVGRATDTTMNVRARVGVRLPQATETKHSAQWFDDRSGDLLRDDPTQPNLWGS